MHHKIEILLPSINHSHAFFRPEYKDDQVAIRWALGAIKSVSIAAMELLVKERNEKGEFKDIIDFFSRVSSKVLNKRQIEALVKSGAFDIFEENRNYIFNNLETLLSYGQRLSYEKDRLQDSLFEREFENLSLKLHSVEKWSREQRLKYQFEAFGFYIKYHPIDIYKSMLEKRRIIWACDLSLRLSEGITEVKLAGIITMSKMRASAKGKFLFLMISDPTGLLDVSIFEQRVLEESFDLLQEGAMLLLTVNARKDSGGIKLAATRVQNLLEYLNSLKQSLYIHITHDNIHHIYKLKEMLSNIQDGNIHVLLKVSLEERIVLIDLGALHNANIHSLHEIEGLFGSNIEYA